MAGIHWQLDKVFGGKHLEKQERAARRRARRIEMDRARSEGVPEMYGHGGPYPPAQQAYNPQMVQQPYAQPLSAPPYSAMLHQAQRPQCIPMGMPKQLCHQPNGGYPQAPNGAFMVPPGQAPLANHAHALYLAQPPNSTHQFGYPNTHPGVMPGYHHNHHNRAHLPYQPQANLVWQGNHHNQTDFPRPAAHQAQQYRHQRSFPADHPNPQVHRKDSSESFPAHLADNMSVATSRAQIGDMQRTYYEGMVPKTPEELQAEQAEIERRMRRW